MIRLPLLLALLIPVDGPQEVPRAGSGAADAAEAAAMDAIRDAREEPFSCVRDGSNPEIKVCAGDDLEREEARMQQYFEVAAARANERDEGSVEYGPRTRQAAWLSESQEAWKAYADVRCAGVRETTSGGTMGGLGYTWCMTDMTRQRTHDIWADYLTYWDSTPPVLPEPVRTIGEDREAAGLT